MSSRFATERVCSRRTTSLIPRSGKRSGCSWNGRMARRQRRTYRDHVAGEHVTAPARSKSSSGGAPNGVRGRPRESLGWITTRAALPRWNRPCVHGAGLRVYRRRALPGLSPPRPEKLARESVASSRRCGRQPARSGTSGIPSSCGAWRRARPGHMVTRCPLCHRPRSMGPPVHIGREHRRTTPFLNQ